MNVIHIKYKQDLEILLRGKHIELTFSVLQEWFENGVRMKFIDHGIGGTGTLVLDFSNVLRFDKRDNKN